MQLCIILLHSSQTYKFMIFENNEVNRWIQFEVLIFSSCLPTIVRAVYLDFSAEVHELIGKIHFSHSYANKSENQPPSFWKEFLFPASCFLGMVISKVKTESVGLKVLNFKGNNSAVCGVSYPK